MAIETDNPIDEEIDIEEEAVVSLPEDGEEEVTEETEAEDFFSNVAETIDDKALKQLASDLISEYDSDKESRKDWEDTYRNGLDLLGFKYKSTTQPFKGASNVTHPLLSEAVTQFQSQAYKELLPSDGPVKTKIVGLQNEEVEAQSQRVKDFMNYQIMEKMEEYTPEFDQLLFYLPLAGSAFKKIYYDSILERAVSKFIPAEDLVVPYYATDLKDAPRITHVLKQSENDLLKKMASGFYMEVDLMKPQKKEDKIQDKYNELEGIKPVETNDYIYNVLEMHVDLDLSDYISEGEDSLGIKIPYIVTIEESTRQILSIYRNYEKDDAKFLRKEYFAHFKFLPGLGFYGFGLIHMIGGLSRTATTALRQLLDAGTLSNLPAGFKSRGMRIRDDDQPIQPGEFRDVDAPGGNIRDQFQLLPFKEPSTTLFNLLGFCVDAGRRFASIADNPTADMNSQAPVGTTIALLERGSRVISAIHKRCYYAMKQEFKLLANVISEYLPPEYPYSVYGAERVIKLIDFDDRVDILPVADPNIFSMSQRVTLAQTQLQIAQSNPQLHNLHEAYRRVYEALGTKEIPQILKPEVKPIPEDPAMENMKAMQMQSLVAFPEQDHDAHIAAHSAFMRTRMVQINPTVYANLQGHISQHVSLKASVEVQQMMQQNPQMIQLSQENPQAFQNMFNSEVAKRVAQITSELAQAEMQADGAKQDPIVMLKQRELDLRAMDLQRRAQEGTIKIENQEDQFEDRLDFDKMKLEQNDDQSEARLQVAREKMELTQKKQEKKMGKKLGLDKQYSSLLTNVNKNSPSGIGKGITPSFKSTGKKLIDNPVLGSRLLSKALESKPTTSNILKTATKNAFKRSPIGRAVNLAVNVGSGIGIGYSYAKNKFNKKKADFQKGDYSDIKTDKKSAGGEMNQMNIKGYMGGGASRGYGAARTSGMGLQDESLKPGKMVRAKNGKMLSAKQKKIARMAPPRNKITGADFKAMKVKKASLGLLMDAGMKNKKVMGAGALGLLSMLAKNGKMVKMNRGGGMDAGAAQGKVDRIRAAYNLAKKNKGEDRVTQADIKMAEKFLKK